MTHRACGDGVVVGVARGSFWGAASSIMVAMSERSRPYLTGELPGVGGVIKADADDFRVDELPLYDASGEGTHVYFRLLKRGLPTPAAVARVARFLEVSPNDVGYAGLKDAQAVTSQWMSVEHVDPAKLTDFRDGQIEIRDVTRHTNKLRRGHLSANRFRVRIRQVTPDAADRARAILDVLQTRGVPNYFGLQRFGLRGDTAELGKALLRDDAHEFCRIYLGRPMDADPPAVQAARAAFDDEDFDRAMKHWSSESAAPRRALSALRKRGPAAAVRTVDKRMRRLFVSAAQSAVFNRVLAHRIDEIDTVRPGDLAKKTDSGGVFEVEDLDTDLPRAAAWQISPTGPIPGTRGRLAGGEAGRIERAAIEAEGLTLEDFGLAGKLRVKGTRRALRFALGEATIEAFDDRGETYLELTFDAPPGSYATVVLREITKSDHADQRTSRG